MSEQSYPVTVAVRRADGSVDNVRVGTAVRAGDGFRLTLGDLAIGGVADAPAPARRAPAAAAPAGVAVFPPYGRSKGAPIAGAPLADLEYYANGCRRTLADPAKSRWHEKERALLAVIEAEIARQRGGGRDDEDHGGGPGGGGGEPDLEDAVPPHGDDDIPF